MTFVNLLINDLDFRDLRDEDDTDVFNKSWNDLSNGNGSVGTPPPPPLPPMPVMANGGGPPMPPPPPPPNGLSFGPSHQNGHCNGLGPPPPPPPPPLSFGTPPPPPRLSASIHWLNSRHTATPSPTPSTDSSGSKSSLSTTATLNSLGSAGGLGVNGLNGSTLTLKNKKTVKLFWREVKEDRSILSRLKAKTIWDEIKPVHIDTKKLEDLFEYRGKELQSKITQEGGVKKNEITVLDTKRSTTINIGLTKLPPPRTIKTAILKMDSSIMNRDGIEKILSNMMPTEEEKTKIIEAQLANPDIPLGTAEQFLLILSSISALEARLKLWAFRLDYEAMEKEVAESLMELKEAISEIEKSDTFKIILATLLSIGNFLNGAEAKGFQIDYLQKVPEVKDTVHKHSLLHHLCTIILEKFPKCTSDLYSEMSAVNRASKIDYDEVGKNLVKLETDCKNSWDHLKVIIKHDQSNGPDQRATEMRTRLSEFLVDCAERIGVLKIIHCRVMNKFRKMLLFLGYNNYVAREIKPHHVLKVISEFALEYRTTRERVKEQIEKEARERERQRKAAAAAKSSTSSSTDTIDSGFGSVGRLGSSHKTNGHVRSQSSLDQQQQQQADQQLRQILFNYNNDYEPGADRFGTLPGTRMRSRQNSNAGLNGTNGLTNGSAKCNGDVNGSTTNGTSEATNGTSKTNNSYSRRISQNLQDSLTGAYDEILESLVKTASTTPATAKSEQRTRKRSTTRFADRKSLRRTLKSGLELTDEERMILANMSVN